MTALKHEEMVAAVKAGYIALNHTLGTNQDPGFRQSRQAHREVLATMYDNLLAFHRPRAADADKGEWRQRRLDDTVIVHRVQSLSCPLCGHSEPTWPDEVDARTRRHADECPGVSHGGTVDA